MKRIRYDLLTQTLLKAAGFDLDGETVVMEFTAQPDRLIAVVLSDEKIDGAYEYDGNDLGFWVKDVVIEIDREPVRQTDVTVYKGDPFEIEGHGV